MKTKSESNGSQDRSSESWRSVEKGKVIEFKKSSTTAAAKFRIGPYIRLSPSGEDRLEGSLVSHPQRIKQFIDLKNAQQGGGWGEIVEWYEDKDLSGKDMNRAAFQRLLNDISTGKINAVVVTELSRLNRKVKDFLEVWEFFKEHKVAFFSLKESFDTSTAMGEVMLIQAMSFAQYERHTIVDRIKKGARARAERGLANGYVPLGFQTVEHRPNHRQINEPERVYVEMIFRKFLELKRIAKLVEWLNKDSFKTKEFITKSGKKAGGHKWTISSLHSILTNRAYIGEREINKKNRTDMSGTLSEEDKYFFVDAHWPALIPKELFYDVQQMLDANKKKARKYTHTYRLTGLVQCGQCGQPMVGKSGTGRNGKHFYYGHKRKLTTRDENHSVRCKVENILALQLEEAVIARFKDYAADKELVTELAKSASASSGASRDHQKSLIAVKKQDSRRLNQKYDNRFGYYFGDFRQESASWSLIKNS